MCGRPSARGATLLELIVFIVILGAAVAGVLGAISYSSRASVDPMIQKQALAIAEAVLEEVQLQPFTYCDPDDAAAPTALSTADCATVENIGAEGGETRAGATPYDNVGDYHGLALGPGFTDIAGTAIAGLDAYTATVSVAGQSLAAIPANEALLISVTVTGPAGTTVTLHGYRARYAPNALP